MKFTLKVFIQYITIILFIQVLSLPELNARHVIDTAANKGPGAADTLQNDTLVNDTLVNDTAKHIKDTTSKGSVKKLQSEVDYESADTIISFLDEKRILLKSNAKVFYEDIELTADYIEIDFDKNELFARGTEDSAGDITGFPVFKEGEEVYESKQIRYNFKTQKGIITDVITEKEGGFLHSQRTKKHTDKIIDLKAGKYTTCDHEHPHYYIAMSRARVIQDDKIVSGPLYLVIEDVPTPFAIPFGFFPFTQEKTSGLIIPRYGESKRRGFSLEELGYYWALNEYMDLKILSSLYSKGSYKANLYSRYKKRYRYTGRVQLMYEKIIESEKGLSDYVNTNAYAVTWHHSQDPKARPNSDFSANVNLRSTSANQYATRMDQYLENTVNSSINYSHQLPGTPFSFNSQLRHTLNTRDSSVSMVLPSMNLNMSRITPFENSNSNKPPNFFEKIGITYQSRLENKFKVKEDQLFEEDVVNEFNFGVKHDVGVSSSAKFLKFFSFSPSANYTERWYFSSIRKQYEDAIFVEQDTIHYGRNLVDTVSGFNRVYDYSMGANVNTTVYGMYKFKPYIPVEAIRFVHTPSVGYSYKPNFTLGKYGYYGNVEGNPDQRYSYYENGIYGVPGGTESGSVNLNLSNQVSMKVRTPKDTASDTKKIDLLKQLNFSTNYNLAVDSLQWSPLSMRASTNLFNNVNVQVNATLDPYALNPVTFQPVDKFQYKVDGKIGRLTSAGMSVSFRVDSKIFEGDEVDEAEQEEAVLSYYDYFDIPWSFNVSYNFNYSKPRNTKTTRQTLRVNGNFSVTDKWKIGVRTGYDFENNKMSATDFNITRDLHCWVMTFHWTPFGRYQSYSFTIGVKSSILQDLKYDQREQWYDQ